MVTTLMSSVGFVTLVATQPLNADLSPLNQARSSMDRYALVAATEAPPRPFRNPWVAAGLGWGAATGLVLLEGPFELPLIPASSFATIVTLSPGGFGAGHFYAGDPLRGALVSLAGPLITTGAAVATDAVMKQMYPCRNAACHMFPDLSPYAYAWLFSGIVYGMWASWDAYNTAERFNASIAPSDTSHERNERLGAGPLRR